MKLRQSSFPGRFATHYHELISMEKEYEGIRNFSVAAVKRGDVQTNFGAEKTAVDLSGNGFFGYRAMLDPFRKLRW